MSTAYLNAFDNVDFGAYGRGAQCFDGFLSQDRVDATLTTSFPGSPQMTIGISPAVYYLVVVLSQPGLVYAGPPADAATIAARAQALPAGWWPMSVQPGHVVYARDL